MSTTGLGTIGADTGDAAMLARARRWRPPLLIADRRLRWGIAAGALLYLWLALSGIPVNWARVAEGLERGGRFVAAFLHPNFTTRFAELSEGFAESLVMTVVATVLGIAVSVPIALGAARNLAPRPVYFFCRGLIALSRTFQEAIIAIFFVAMFGRLLPRRSADPGVRDRRLPRQAAGRGHRGHRPRPGGGDPGGRLCGCSSSTTASSRR